MTIGNLLTATSTRYPPPAPYQRGGSASRALGDNHPGHLSQILMVEGGDSQTTATIGGVPFSAGGIPVPFGSPQGLSVFNGAPVPITVGGGIIAPGVTVAPGAAIPGAVLPAQKNAIFNRNAIGWNIRANFGFDLASNTAYGPLIGHFDINSDLGNGFDSPNGSATYVNTGYVTWAGLTAGKAQSFFSFIGGGDNWNNFFSPDEKGFNEPLLLAYTASFGGGFTATLAAQSQGTVGGSGGGTNLSGSFSPGAADGPGGVGPTTFGGERWPDIVGALHVKQGWGEAQVSGVAHNVNVRDYNFFQTASCGITGLATCQAQQGKVGWGVDAGVKWNLTNGGMFGNWWGAGDDVILTGAYTRNAVWYSGIPDAMNGENGQVNGNGQRDCQESCVRGHSDADGGRIWQSKRTPWTVCWRGVTRRLFSTGYSTS